MVFEPPDFDPAASPATGKEQRQEGSSQSNEQFRRVVTRVWEEVKYPLRRFLSLAGPDAEDIIQDGFEKLWREQEKLSDADIRVIKAWVFTTCHRLAIDRHRRRQHFQWLSINWHRQDEEGKEAEWDLGDEGFEREFCDAISDRDLCARILSRLEKGEQECLILRYVADMKPQEIAKVLHLSPGSISTRLFRAKEHARAILKELGGA